MVIYETSLASLPSNDFHQAFLAGEQQLDVRFIWNKELQEQYDLLIQGIKTSRDADPLLKGMQIIRDYEYFSYYASLPATAEELTEALEEGLEYPQSLKNLSNELKADRLLEAKALAVAQQKIIEPYEWGQCWHLVITDITGNQVTADLRPNGWINNQDSSWKIRFVSTLDKISHDDLLLCKVEVAVNE